MLFQEISIPAPGEVNRNSKGEGFFKNLNVTRGGGGLKIKTFHGKGMDIFWHNTIHSNGLLFTA